MSIFDDINIAIQNADLTPHQVDRLIKILQAMRNPLETYSSHDKHLATRETSSSLSPEELQTWDEALSQASGLSVTIPKGAALNKLALGPRDVVKLVIGTQHRTKDAIVAIEKTQAALIEAVRSITIAAFCDNGQDTRTAIRQSTHELSATLSVFKSNMQEIFSTYRFLEIRSSVVDEILSYALELRDLAEQYFLIEPDHNQPDYRMTLRYSHDALNDLRNYISDHDWRFVELLDMLTGVPRDIDVRRYIKSRAMKINDKPERGQYAEIGKQVYHDLTRLRKRTRLQRRAMKELNPYFYDAGDVADVRGLGIFMSKIYKLMD